MLRVEVLNTRKGGVDALLAYYGGLAKDQRSRDGVARGPIDYYLDPNEPPGRWWGAGCEALGLAGDVTPEQMSALLSGKDPQSGKPLGRGFSARGARGYDATFSPPKSVSVLWALSPNPFVQAEVLAAHDAAVEAALSWLERHGAVTRRGRDGIDQVDTRGLAVARFRQHTSRSTDPQIHTHAIVMAKVQGPTGRWLSLDARFLLRQQRSLGWVYDAALRAELSARLGLEWEPLEPGKGQADIVGIERDLRDLFSQRSTQVEEKLAELLAAWSDGHEGKAPDRWTIYRLTRKAVIESRPAKGEGVVAEVLRAEWVERALEAGFELTLLPSGEGMTRRAAALGVDAIVAEALERVSAETSAWLRADLAREIATLIPSGVIAGGETLTVLVDELAERAAAECVELHPPALPGIARRRDGRPVSEHVTDRLVTTRAVLDQEARLLDWARAAVDEGDADRATIEVPDRLTAPQASAAGAVAGHADLVLIVGPAGTGKTTTLAAAVARLEAGGRAVVGLAPTGRAADVLAAETGAPAATLAKLLFEHARPAGPGPQFRLPPGTTVIVDEAGTASTNDLDRLVGLAERQHWRVVAVGDPDQLPAVGRGGMFAHWCEHVGAHRLEEVQRFEEPWQGEASLRLRRGDSAAVAEYAARGRVVAMHPAVLPDQVARRYQAVARKGETLAITTASVETARAINRAIQRRLLTWRSGVGVRLRDGTEAFVGDRVATRRNDPALEATSGASMRNRQTWVVAAVHPDGSLRVEDRERGAVHLPARYVASHVESGWAVTGYGSQGVTTDHGICVVEQGSSRAGVYVGMTRGRHRNIAIVVDRTGETDPTEALARVIERPPRGLSAHAVREQLYAQQGLPVPADPSLAVDDIERMRARLDRLQSPSGLDRAPRGLTR